MYACQHDRTRLEADVAAGIGPWRVVCADCGDAGPVAESDREAVVAWLEVLEAVDVWCWGQSPAALERLVQGALL